ncbi:CotY/CotZ family spore coat protein [Sporosarcina jiandibaonis]|uniref:CotY/CotZ family spore coat protein n=1 Tax=Sporosarcina jiandibaonis TaxID=2715535 RepID=UPI001553D6D5|nr:CotY/CotZ family spore coat protein [Sporosarcina jiandibaonis]
MGCGREDDVRGVRHHDSCICEVVRAIKRIQGVRDEDDCDDCITDCFISPLGGLVSPTRGRINTRVFMLLTDDGDPFKAMFKRQRRRRRNRDRDHGKDGRDGLGSEHGRDKHRDRDNCFSVFFRVQNVFDNCCATLQVLEPRDEDGRRVDILKNGKIDFDKLCDVEEFEATDSCITVDLKCFCGVQCIKDVFIDCDRD